MPHADFLRLGDWNAVCSMCNGKFKASELKKHWQGMYRCVKCWEPRHPQDFVRSVPDNPTPPWVQPETSHFINPRTQGPAGPNINAGQTDDGVVVTWTQTIFGFGTQPEPRYTLCISVNGGEDTCFTLPWDQTTYVDPTIYNNGAQVTYKITAEVASNGVWFRSEEEEHTITYTNLNITPYEYISVIDSGGAVKVARRHPSPTEGDWEEVASFPSTYLPATGYCLAACKNEVIVRTMTGSSAAVLQKSEDYGETWASDSYFAPANIMLLGSIGDWGFLLLTLTGVFIREVGSTSWDGVGSAVGAALGGTYANSSVGQWTTLRGSYPTIRFGEWTCVVLGQILSTSPYQLHNYRVVGTKNGTDWVVLAAENPGVREFHDRCPSAVGDELWVIYSLDDGSYEVEKIDAEGNVVEITPIINPDFVLLTAGDAVNTRMLVGGSVNPTLGSSTADASCVIHQFGLITPSGLQRGTNLTGPFVFGDGAYLGFAQRTGAAPGLLRTGRVELSSPSPMKDCLSMTGTVSLIAYATNKPLGSMP